MSTPPISEPLAFNPQFSPPTREAAGASDLTSLSSALAPDTEEQSQSAPETASSQPLITVEELSLVHGDVFIKGSQLDKKRSLIDDAQLLKTLLEEMPSDIDLTSIKEKLESLIAWEEQLQRLENAKQIDLIATAICSTLKTLGHGNSITLPGGNKNKTLIYEISKNADDTFSFQIINNSNSTQHHFNEAYGLKTKITPFFTLTGITLEQLVGTEQTPKNDLFVNLLTFQASDEPFGKVDIEQIYASVVGYFSKERVSITPLSPDDFVTPSRSKNSFWKSLMALMRQTLSKENYKKVVFSIKEKTLISFFTTNEELLKEDSAQARQARELLTLSAKKLSTRSSKTTHEDLRILTPADAEAAQNLVENILLKIEAYKKNIHAQKSVTTEPLDISQVTKPTIRLTNEIPVVISASKQRHAFQSMPGLDFKKHSFLENLNFSQEVFRKAYSTSLSLQRQLIIDFVKKAPKPWDTSYYEAIPSTETSEILTKLYHYFNGCIRCAVANGFKAAIDKITLFSLYAMILDLSLIREEQSGFSEEDRLSKIFGVDFDSGDLIEAENFMQSPYDRAQWELIRGYFNAFTSDRIVHQQSYILDIIKNEKPSHPQARLLYYFHEFTRRHLSELNSHLEPYPMDHARLTRDLFIGIGTCRSFNPSNGSYAKTFDQIGFGHLPILSTASMYLQHLFSGNKKIPLTHFNSSSFLEGLCFSTGSFYKCTDFRQTYNWSTGQIEFSDTVHEFTLTDTTHWHNYGGPKKFKAASSRSSQRTLIDISSSKSRIQSQAEAALVDDPNLATEEAQKKLQEVLADIALPGHLERHQIPKDQASEYIKEAEEKIESTKQEIPYLIAHAATHNPLRLIELLGLASDNLEEFENISVRSDFLEQFFKLPIHDYKFSYGAFSQVEDLNFQRAFIEFLSKYKESTVNFSIFIFGMKIGVLLLPYLKEDSFKEAIYKELEALSLRLKNTTNPKEIYSLHLLIALKEAFIFQSLFKPQPDSSTSTSEGAATSSSSDEIQPHLQECFNSLLMSWMWIRIKNEKQSEFDDIYQMLEDLVYPILGLPITERLIDDKALKSIVKKVTGVEILTEKPSRALKFNSIVRMFDDSNKTCVDLFKGTVTTRSDDIKTVSFDEVYMEPMFKRIFGNKRGFEFTKTDSWYHFVDPLKGSFRVQTRPVFLLEKAIDCNWARILEDKVQGMPDADWAAVVALKKDIESHCLILKTAYFCYQGKKGYYYISKSGDKNVYFIPRESSLTIQKIDNDTSKFISEIIPVSFLSAGFQKLISKFEDCGFVYLERSGEEVKLIFPRYKSSSKADQPLTFILCGEDWLLESNKSKRLCKAYSSTLIENFESFLTLETIATKKLSALIPETIYESGFISFAAGAKLDFTSSNADIQTQRLSYDDIPFDGELFQPSTTEHKLRLFYLAVGQFKFDLALEYFKKLSASDMKTAAQQEKAQKVLTYLEKKEQTPESIALQMHLGYLLFYYEFIKASQIEPETEAENSTLVKIHSLYNKYCNRLSHIPLSFRLSFEQESLLLQKMPFLSSAATARVASCPELMAGRKITPSPLPRSLPINLVVDKPFLEYIRIPNHLEKLAALEEEALQSLEALNLTRLIELVTSNPYIYDLVYNARQDEGQKKRLNELLHLASFLTKNSPAVEHRLIHKLCIMLNDSEGPSTLKTLREDLIRNNASRREELIEEWRRLVTSYLYDLNEREEFALPQNPLQVSPYPHPHLKVVNPSKASLSFGATDQPKAASALFRSTSPELSWDEDVPESTSLKTLESIKSQLNQSYISFNYGLICEKDSIESLEEIALTQSDPLLKGAFGKAFETFIKGFGSIPEDEKSIPDLNTDQLQTMEDQLSLAIDDTKVLVKAQLDEILFFAHSPEKDARLARVISGFLVSGVFKKVTIEQLQLLFLSSNKEAFKNACPQLSEEEIHTLYNKLSQYLYMGIHLKQMKRLKQAMASLREELNKPLACEPAAPAEAAFALMAPDESPRSTKQALASDGTMLRPEVVSKALFLKMITKEGIKGKPSAQHLLFEHISHIFRVKPDQKRLIEELSKSPHKIAQVLMGGGKTTVLAANLLAKGCAEGKIAIMITPDFQYEAVYKTIQETLKNVFNIEVVTFHHTKEELTLSKLEALEFILLRVKNSAANHEPKVLLLRPETLQFLTLEWLHTLNQIKQERHDEDLLIKWRTLSNILKLLKEEGYSLGDEVHILLDIVKEIYIPIGEFHSVDQENISLVRDIFKIIDKTSLTLSLAQKTALEKQLSQSKEAPLEFIAKPDGSFSIKVSQFLKLRENQQSYCSTKIYKQLILPEIASCLALTNSPSLMLDSKQQKSFCRYVQDEIRGDLQHLVRSEEVSVLDPTETNDLDFLKHLHALHQAPSETRKKAADLIALSKYVLSDLLPSLLSKTGNIHFGRKEGSETPGEVVPYLCANTASSNKFGNHYEAIVYHFMCALMFGVEDEQIKQLFMSWDKEARKLSRANLAYNETTPSMVCKKLFGILPCEINDNFETIKRSLQTKAPSVINQLFAIEEDTIKRCVKYQKETISAHAHMLAGVCKQFQGLSGTFHLEEFFLKLQQHPELDITVNPLCIRAFLEKPSPVLISKEISPDLFMSENFNKLQTSERQRLCALLDAGGLFKDFENKAVAKTLLQKLKAEARAEIRAVIFFTKLNGSSTADYPVLMKVDSDEEELLNGTSIDELLSKGLKPCDYAVYLDSRHCTGIDIKLHPNALGFLTYDPSMGLDTTTQAMMRFRDFLINQSLVVVVPEYSCSLLPKTDKTLQEFVADKNQLEAKKILLAQMIIKQVEQGSTKMIKSFKKMLEYSVFEEAKKHLLLATDLDAIKQIAYGFKASLLCQTEDTPYLSFGSLSSQVDTVENLLKTSAKILTQLKQNLETARFAPADVETIIVHIQDEHQLILERAEAIKPQFISKIMELISGTNFQGEGNQREMSLAIDHLQQVEQEQRVEQQVQQQIEQQVQQEYSRLQLRKKQTPKALVGFDPTLFLKQMSSEHPIQGNIEPIERLFDAPLHEYASLFEDSPLLVTTHFREPFIRPTHLFDASHSKARPFQYLLVCRRAEDSSYRAVVVSGFEASQLTTLIRENKCADVWLTCPSARLQAGEQTSWEVCCQNEIVKSMMLTFNLLGGNTKYLFENVDQYCLWYLKHDQSSSTAETSKLKRFLKLIALSHPLTKDLILSYLLEPSSLTDRLSLSEQLKRLFAFDDVDSFQINPLTVPLLSVHQLQGLSSETLASSAKHLTSKQIGYIPGPLVAQLPQNTISYLCKDQVRFTTKDQIPFLSCDLISQLKQEDLAEVDSFLQHLTQEQYFALEDPDLINRVPGSKLRFINPAMTPRLHPLADRLKQLIVPGQECIHFGYLSRPQLEALSKESDPASLFEKIPFKFISKLPLTATTHEGTDQECAGFISYLSTDQREQLKEDQIKEIKHGKDLVKIKPSKWTLAKENVIKDISLQDIQAIPALELTQDLLERFSEEQIQALNQEQVIHLSEPNKCLQLTPEQLDWLTPQQYETLTEEILIKKVPSPKLMYINPEMTPLVGPFIDRLKSLVLPDQEDCFHFSFLSREQLEVLNKSSDRASLFQKIPVDAIKNLPLSETTHEGTDQECTGFIPHLSQAQLAELTSAQVGQIKHGKDLAKLRPIKWRYASKAAIQGLSQTDIGRIAVLTYLLDKLSPLQITFLNQNQVQSLPDPNQCPFLTHTQVNWLTPDQCLKLTSQELIEKLHTSKLRFIQPAMTPKIGPVANRLKSLIIAGEAFCDHFGRLSREQLEALSKDTDAFTLFAQIPLGAIENLDLTRTTYNGSECAGFIEYLTHTQRKKLTKEQIALIQKAEDLERLETSSWEYASIQTLQKLSTQKISEIPPKELTPLLLGKLSPEQGLALTQTQVQNLVNPNQCLFLSSEQVNWLTEAQYCQLTAPELIEKIQDSKLHLIHPTTTPKIGTSADRLKNLMVAGQDFCEHFGHLSRAQLEALSKDSDKFSLFTKIPLGAIKTLDLTATTHAGTQNECHGFIEYLNQAQRKQLTEEQIALIESSASLELIESSAWRYASIKTLSSLPIQRIQELPTENITPLLLSKLSQEQIQNFNKDQVQHLPNPNQCPFLSQRQVAWLTKDQHYQLRNPELIQKVSESNLIHIHPEMTVYIGLNIQALKRLALDSPGTYSKHFGYLSRNQLELILQSPVEKEVHCTRLPNFTLNFELRPLGTTLAEKISPEDIPRLALTKTPCLIKHLNEEQKAHLTPDQIEQIEFLQDFLLVPPHLWQYGRESLLRQLTEDHIPLIPSEGITDRLLRKLSQDQAENFSRKQIKGMKNPNEGVRLPAAQLSWLPNNCLHLLTDESRMRMCQIISIASERFSNPVEILPPSKDATYRRSNRSIGSGFLEPGARSTQDFWLDLERKTKAHRLTNSGGSNTWQYLFYPFQASSEDELERLWDAVFSTPTSIIIDLTTKKRERISDYQTGESSWWRAGARATERLITVELASRDPVTNIVTYKILKKLSSALSLEEEERQIFQASSSLSESRAVIFSRNVQKYENTTWPADGLITIQNLHRMVQNIEKLVSAVIIQKKDDMYSKVVADDPRYDSLKPFFWVRGDEGTGSTDTLMAALAVKQKFDLGHIRRDNFDRAIEDIILGVRKEKGPSIVTGREPVEFIERSEQLDILRRYANALINYAPISLSVSIQNTLWKELQEQTRVINKSAWRPQAFGDVYFPQESFEIDPGTCLTAHRVGSKISQRYFVALKAPTKTDWTYFWTAIFERDSITVVDLTECNSYAGFEGVYYPERVGEKKICEHIEILCKSIEGNICTYDVTDTSGAVDITKTIRRYHYREWSDGAAITLAQLQALIQNIESLASNPKNPLWIHCLMGVGRTGTLITALILKEKKAQLTQENIQEILLAIIVSCRKERAAEFVQTQVQFDLLYQYALSLIWTFDKTVAH